MRVQYWPNEPVVPGGTVKDDSRVATFTQAGGRAAFAEMLQNGEISALDILPYRERFHVLNREFPNYVMKKMAEFKPDVIFVQHVTGCPLPSNLWSQISSRFPGTTIVYHDADPYSRMTKGIDASMSSILSVCHLSFVCGLGYVYEAFNRLSSGPVRYSPHCFDHAQFHALDVRKQPKEYDLIMIGNRGTRRRAKFLYHPGGRTRARLAKAVSEEYGAAFALYGSGWQGLTASRGRLEFFDQERAIQSARVSINWDHFDDIPYYFSDRLPISLVAGVPHVTSYHSGYEHIFSNCRGLYSCRSWQEVVECTRWLLSKRDEDLLDLGLAAQRWVENNLSAPAVFRQAITLSARIHRSRGGVAP